MKKLRRDLNRSPWCIWDGRRPIAEDKVVLSKLLSYIESSKRERLFKRLASVYLVSFPHNRNGLSSVAEVLMRISKRFDGPWSKAAAELELFDATEGPRRVARAALEAKKPASQILESYGITISTSETKFIEAAFLVGLDFIKNSASRNPDEHLQNLKAWGLKPSGDVLFDEHRGSFVDALVLPFSDPMPSKQVRDSYLSFLVSKFGDPRLRSGRWTAMPSSAAIVRRWLTDQSLRQFLDVLDDSALQHQWKFRRAFWEAVYRRGLIAEAWVVFDKVSANRAKLIFKGETPFARWEGGGSKQIQNGQACLLLRIGSGIVAEWSHNGRCYIWHDINDPSAPTMHKETYQTDEMLVREYDSPHKEFRRTVVVHQHAKLYSWQTKISDALVEMTGFRIHKRDFEVT